MTALPKADDDLQQKRHVQGPKVCVDYLSYRFDEMDLAASWRVVTKQKNDIIDGIRLENASWRTWAKTRNNLKTVPPQTLNWLKESDVTWLYGPLHTVIDRLEESQDAQQTLDNTRDALGLMTSYSIQAPWLKPALKKTTIIDEWKRSARQLSSSIDTATIQPATAALLSQPVSRQTRLRFNHQVEQCIAVSSEEENNGHDTDQSDDDNEYSHNIYIQEHTYPHVEDYDFPTDDEDQTDGAWSIQRRDSILHCASTSRNPTPVTPDCRPSSIKKIAPTRLKRSHSDPETDEVSSVSSFSTTSTNSISRYSGLMVHSSPYHSSSDSDEGDELDERARHQENDHDDDQDSPSSTVHTPTSTSPENGPSSHSSQTSAHEDGSEEDEPQSAHVAEKLSYSKEKLPMPFDDKVAPAEPILTTTRHIDEQSISSTAITTATTATKSSFLDNITQWATSFLWPGKSHSSFSAIKDRSTAPS
ncbi:uncharacterized protein BYT42DRAFT_567071 [Radiomyces spectabilis]|uniref:uncharacterized protein n=1 Tax=Radiomyces spectabilis TaxID=64574 RepID=UPI0022210D3C|nr:uncharacterized protein BYT42DRAFT_567071 [Radiomyces spectabilis]KAI8381585.1 hypothetical protein BYT42DRAFT_567071 [Radiomyces spectabilis]